MSQMFSSQGSQRLTDREIAEDLLTGQKYMLNYYYAPAILESSANDVRSTFQHVHNSKQHDAKQIFDYLNSKGWYHVREADNQAINDLRNTAEHAISVFSSIGTMGQPGVTGTWGSGGGWSTQTQSHPAGWISEGQRPGGSQTGEGFGGLGPSSLAGGFGHQGTQGTFMGMGQRGSFGGSGLSGTQTGEGYGGVGPSSLWGGTQSTHPGSSGHTTTGWTGVQPKEGERGMGPSLFAQGREGHGGFGSHQPGSQGSYGSSVSHSSLSHGTHSGFTGMSGQPITRGGMHPIEGERGLGPSSLAGHMGHTYSTSGHHFGTSQTGEGFGGVGPSSLAGPSSFSHQSETGTMGGSSHSSLSHGTHSGFTGMSGQPITRGGMHPIEGERGLGPSSLAGHMGHTHSTSGHHLGTSQTGEGFGGVGPSSLASHHSHGSETGSIGSQGSSHSSSSGSGSSGSRSGWTDVEPTEGERGMGPSSLAQKGSSKSTRRESGRSQR